MMEAIITMQLTFSTSTTSMGPTSGSANLMILMVPGGVAATID